MLPWHTALGTVPPPPAAGTSQDASVWLGQSSRHHALNTGILALLEVLCGRGSPLPASTHSCIPASLCSAARAFQWHCQHRAGQSCHHGLGEQWGQGWGQASHRATLTLGCPYPCPALLCVPCKAAHRGQQEPGEQTRLQGQGICAITRLLSVL